MGLILGLFRWIFKILAYGVGIALLIGFIMGMLAVRKWWMSEEQVTTMEQGYKTDTAGKSNTWNYGTPKQHNSKKHRKSK